MKILDSLTRKPQPKIKLKDIEYKQFFIMDGTVCRRTERQPIEMNFGPPHIEVYFVNKGYEWKWGKSEQMVEPIRVELHIIK